MGSNHVDRLSNIPDEVLSEILSLMPTKFAVRTSILSKRWRYKWTLVTNIDIDVLPFHGVENCCTFVDRVLDLCKTTEIKLFRLRFSNLWLQDSRITRWIDEAVRLNVRNLEIQSVMLELPLSLFTCKTLTKLTIENLNSVTDLEWQTPFNLPFVKTLDIGVYDNPSLTAFRLICGCPVLESLSFYIHYRCNEEEYRFSIPTLKHLKLDIRKSCGMTDVNKIVLNVPNLEDLFVGGWWRSVFVMEDFPSLVSVTFSDFTLRYSNLWVEFFKGIVEAKSLSFMPDSDPPNAPLPRFQNLKYLEFKCGYDFKLIFEFLESCFELEHISIEEDQQSCWNEPPTIPTCIINNLKTIKYTNCEGREDDMQFLEYMLQNAEVLKTLTITCKDERPEEEMRLCAKLLKCPRASRYCEIHFASKSIDSASS